VIGEESLLTVVVLLGGSDVGGGCAGVVEEEEEKPGIYTILTVDARLVTGACLTNVSSCSSCDDDELKAASMAPSPYFVPGMQGN